MSSFLLGYIQWYPIIMECNCADDSIRQCVIMALDERFDPHLAQAENLTTMFVAMHDGVSMFSLASNLM